MQIARRSHLLNMSLVSRSPSLMNVHFSIYSKLEMKTFEGKLFKMHSMLMTFDLIEVRDSETRECFVRSNRDFRR